MSGISAFWLFITIGLSVCAVGAYFSEKDADRLVKQCIDDGRREYECVALLRSHSSGSTMVPMPIVIPMR